MLLIQNATVYTMEEDGVLENADILCENGKITAVGRNLSAPGAQVIDGSGLVVTPGLLDAHTHTGCGIADALQDCNEMTNPVTPEMNIIHSVDITLPEFRQLHREGVTSVCIIPGSGNVVCGQGIVAKTAGEKSIYDLTVKNPAVMKCAMGGNPKGVYGKKGQQPMTRMGVAATLRDTLRRAKTYMEERANEDVEKRPPFDPKLEALIPVLRREIPLKVHSEQFDMVTLIGIAREFGCDYSLEHAWAANLYADELVEGGGSVCFGPIGIPEGVGELTGGDVSMLRELDERGLNVCLVTDYPLLTDNILLIEAGEAVRYGIPHDRALRMITINPAKSLGVADRLGSIAVGKDADLVIWSAIPALETRAKVLHTIINGKIVYSAC